MTFLGSIVFSPLSLLIRVLSSLLTILPGIGIPVWTSAFGNIVTLICSVGSAVLTVGYFKTGKLYFAAGFGIAFFILNTGNVAHFLAMMRV